MKTGLWYPDLAEIGNLYETWDYDRQVRGSLAKDLAELEANPPVELVFATTGANQKPANKTLHGTGWKLAGTVRNWSAWERGRSRCFVWCKQFPKALPLDMSGADLPYAIAERWNNVRGACMFCCGVRMLRTVTTSHKLLCILRLKRTRQTTVARIKRLGFRQFAKTKLATYYINGEDKWAFDFGEVTAA